MIIRNSRDGRYIYLSNNEMKITSLNYNKFTRDYIFVGVLDFMLHVDTIVYNEVPLTNCSSTSYSFYNFKKLFVKNEPTFSQSNA